MNTVFFFVLINCSTTFETRIQWREVCITKRLIAQRKNVITLEFLRITARIFKKSFTQKAI